MKESPLVIDSDQAICKASANSETFEKKKLLLGFWSLASILLSPYLTGIKSSFVDARDS